MTGVQTCALPIYKPGAQEAINTALIASVNNSVAVSKARVSVHELTHLTMNILTGALGPGHARPSLPRDRKSVV